MPAIFISYRKEDTPGDAAHLYKNLCESFGAEAILMDVASRQPGRDVRTVIDEHLATSAVVLVVMGKGWAGAKDESGQRRLDSPMDGVRIEVAAALRSDLPVIPVLVQGAAMVQPGELPSDLADLAFRNPVTLLQSQWGSDVEMLVTLLRSLVQGQGQATPLSAETQGQRGAAAPAAAPAAASSVRVVRPQPVGQLPWRSMLAAMVALIVLALGVYAFMASRPPRSNTAVAQAQEAAALAVAKAQAAEAEALAAQALSVKNQAQRDAARAEAQKADAAKAAAASAPAPTPTPAPAPAPVNPPPAAATPAPQPVLPATASTSAKVLSVQKWSLNSGGCGAGPVTVVGTARFTVEKTSDAIVVSEEFRGSGNGFDVVVTGQVEFAREQPSYDIPTSGQWTGATRTFKSTGMDRVTAPDGTTPKGASVIRVQSVCG